MSDLPMPQLVWPLSDRGLQQRLSDLATLPFVTGEHPHARQAFFADVHSLDPFQPDGGTLARELVQDSGDRQRLIVGDGWAVHLVLLVRRPEVQLLVTATSAETADRILDDLRAAVPPPERAEAQARVTLWSVSATGGPTRHRRWIDTPRWDAIDGNYPGEVRDVLADLMAMGHPAPQAGRLLLWYGDPGTGKTTAIRALAHEWASWADVHFVVDPEAFFGSPDYLLQVVADEDMWDPRWAASGGRWKVLVIEDADELIRADARGDSGASLGRLLNLGDGILGHGLRVLVLITTNEPMRGLHPAVVRPGRCLADVQFRRFTHAEAATWLAGAAEAPSGEQTLAELFRTRGDLHPLGNTKREASRGTYL